MTNKTTFTYRNPHSSEVPGSLRDPQIINVNDRYYLTATSQEYWKGNNPGIKLWSSDDLLNWRFENLLIDSSKVPQKAWYKDRFWAPEIHEAGGMFFLTFSCNKGIVDVDKFGVGIARASKITGPYEIMSKERPLVEESIDGSLFSDDDGKHYIVVAAEEGLRLYEIQLPSCRLISNPWVSAIRGEEGEWDYKGIEGPFIIKRKGIYYQFYSSFTRGYEVGILTAHNIRGPWMKYPSNPILTSSMKIGHNCVFTGPDGRDWLAYHMHDKNDVEKMAYDPMWIDEYGDINTDAPTSTKQKIIIMNY